MTLRTPRRRISPRTRRRYRAVKNFFRRALGGASQPHIELNYSSLTNVTDLKQKIGVLEHPQSHLEKNSYDFARLDNSFRKNSYTLVNKRSDEVISLKKQHAETGSIRFENKSKVLNKTSGIRYRKSDNIVEKSHNAIRTQERMMSDADVNLSRYKMQRKKKIDTKVNDGESYLRKHRTQSACGNLVSSYSTSSYHSLRDPPGRHALKTVYPVRHYAEKKYDYTEPDSFKMSKAVRNHSGGRSPFRKGEFDTKHQKKQSHEIDQSYITDIIKRQYKPVKMFEKKESNFSQFSAPICRDQEFPLYENIQKSSQLCSCCFDTKSKYNCHELSDGHSVCDTRLYSSEKEMRHRNHRKQRKHNSFDTYNNSELYDLVPVREKSSPKIRRKMVTDNKPPYDYIKELPPSPRTQRPQLNLKAQNYNEFEQCKLHRHVPDKNFSHRKYDFPDHMVKVASDLSSARHHRYSKSQFNKIQKVSPRYDVGSSIPLSDNVRTNIANESIFNKTQDTDLNVDKTDRTLNEIKDILHSFLLEIKKDTTTSHVDNSDAVKCGEKSSNDYKSCGKSNSRPNVNVMGATQCNMPLSYLPYTNPCCYPVLPVCPMTCVPNSCIVPCPSFTCASCINNPKENSDDKPTNTHDSVDIKCNETEKLIKEIYNFVTHSSENNDRQFHGKIGSDTLSTNKKKANYMSTPRSAREGLKLSKHDAIVGTPKIKCYSKSCEAIGSKMNSDSYYSRISVTHSDTVLERLSLEQTVTSESESSLNSFPVKAVKQNKFAKILRSFGLMKKKNSMIEEVSETESTIEVDVKPKSPFRQEITNYMMHGQDYYNAPSTPRNNLPNQHTTQHNHPYCGANCHATHMQNFNINTYCPPKHTPQHDAAAYHSPMPYPSAPPYPNHGDHYNYNQTPVPLCLKEVEVKSMATQSDRKMSFFHKFTKKLHGPTVVSSTNDAGARNCSTQTAGQSVPLKFNKPGKFNWRSLQAKVNELDKPGNGDFTYKTQKRLADGDMKMKNAMLKKMFYKRNPFSPRNLIVRTILGKDKSSFGEPPMMYRPRMFF